METDASLIGWGAYQNPDSFTQGRWSPTEARLHINYLELKAVFLGIKALFPSSPPISLLILCDNTPTVNYINNMGGTKSRFLCSLTLEIWDYCLSHNIWIKASYLPGLENIRADCLSHSCTLFDPRERGSLHIKKNLSAHLEFKMLLVDRALHVVVFCQILFYKLYIDKGL